MGVRFFRRSSRRRRAADTGAGQRFRWLRWILIAFFLVVAADALYLFAIWPDWQELAAGPTPKSNIIRGYEDARTEDKRLPPLRWKPVPLARIAPAMRRAVVVAEDGRFWRHEGIDTEAIKDAVEYNMEKGRVVYGASTISQQTTKNLFLSNSRDPLRKWHELLLTLSMERNLKKSRILELYLNVAEFGPGVFGVEAAARHYYGVSAAALTPAQAISLAASLPSPRLHNPKTGTKSFERRKRRITRHLTAFSPPG